MPDILAQMFFSVPVGRRRMGWSEGHYYIPAGTLPDALVALKALARLRVNLVGMGVTCDYLRVSQLGIFRDSQVDVGPIALVVPGALVLQYGITNPDVLYNQRLITDIPATGIQRGKGLSSDFPWVAYMIRLEGGTVFRSRRSYHIAGNPDVANNTDDNAPTGAEWTRAYNAFLGASRTAGNTLLGGKWGFKALDVGADNPEKTISAISNVAPFPLTITGHTFLRGDDIQIRGAKVAIRPGEPIPWDINGRWTVDTVPVAGETITLRGYPGPVNFDQFGKARLRKYVTLAYNNVVGRRWSRKALGNPFDPIHGRSKQKGRVYRVRSN